MWFWFVWFTAVSQVFLSALRGSNRHDLLHLLSCCGLLVCLGAAGVLQARGEP